MPETLHEWFSENPPGDGRFRASLAGIARRTRHGDDFLVAVRDLLDEWAVAATDAQRSRMLIEEPSGTGDERFDAFLGALAEHLALSAALGVPSWALAPGRFLDRFWFVSPTPGFRALAIAQSPAAFRRRCVFTPRRSLERV